MYTNVVLYNVINTESCNILYIVILQDILASYPIFFPVCPLGHIEYIYIFHMCKGFSPVFLCLEKLDRCYWYEN